MTLPPVGADHEEVTLGDFKAISDEDFASFGTCQLKLLNAAGQSQGNYCYLDYELADAEGEEEGWYDYDQYLKDYSFAPAGYIEIDSGAGVMIMSDAGCNLTVLSALK